MKKSEINVLIIDDDKSMRGALTELVKRKGYRAIAVARPEEAESLVKIKPIHGLIVDVMLPGTNGVDLVIKLKENLIDNAVIFFISGIYRDRSFSLDAIRKVEATDYLVKPFNNEELLAKLEKGLSEYVDVPKLDLHALLATPFASQRDRRKALDRVEDMTGFDLPFIFCILMDSESSGHLNIVDQDQSIYGVTFCQGAIAKIDSEATSLLTKNILIQHGFITEQDIVELDGKKNRGDIVKSLIDNGLMSPHVSGIIKSETMFNEINKIISSKKIKINFVPDRKIKSENDNIDMKGFLFPLHEMVEKQIPLDWIKNFYAAWAGHPIRPGPQFADHVFLSNFPIVRSIESLFLQFKNELTLEDIIAANPKITEAAFYRALHFLMLRRLLVFEESKRVKNLDEHVNRLKAMHDELKDKNPIEVFQFFGLSNDPKVADLTRIYKEFARSHHPDTLPQAVSKEVKSLNHELFAKVTAAYEILSDENKREKFYNELKSKEADLQIKSDEIVSNAANLLNQGKYSDALPLLEKSIKIFKSERALLHWRWAQFKIEGMLDAKEIDIIQTEMRNLDPGSKKSPIGIFVNGLLKSRFGDFAGAEADFKKVLSLDNNFMDARRELINLKSKKPTKLTAEEILKGDLSVVVKNLFNRRKGA